MKPVLKAILFLVTLTIFDFALKKGPFAFFLPLKLPFSVKLFILYAFFAIIALLITKRFCKTDKLQLSDLGISLNAKNRLDFFYGLLVGLILWALVCLLQSYLTGFSWTFRPDLNPWNLLYGLVIIFIADLSTELGAKDAFKKFNS